MTVIFHLTLDPFLQEFIYLFLERGEEREKERERNGNVREKFQSVVWLSVVHPIQARVLTRNQTGGTFCFAD